MIKIKLRKANLRSVPKEYFYLEAKTFVEQLSSPSQHKIYIQILITLLLNMYIYSRMEKVTLKRVEKAVLPLKNVSMYIYTI